MKPTNDYLETSLWYKLPINDPNQVIAEFFTAAALKDYRKRIKEVVKASFGKHIWRKKNPGALLYYFKMIESIINAAYLINKKINHPHFLLTAKIHLIPISFVVGMRILPNGIFFPRFYHLKNMSIRI